MAKILALLEHATRVWYTQETTLEVVIKEGGEKLVNAMFRQIDTFESHYQACDGLANGNFTADLEQAMVHYLSVEVALVALPLKGRFVLDGNKIVVLNLDQWRNRAAASAELERQINDFQNEKTDSVPLPVASLQVLSTTLDKISREITDERGHAKVALLQAKHMRDMVDALFVLEEEGSGRNRKVEWQDYRSFQYKLLHMQQVERPVTRLDLIVKALGKIQGSAPIMQRMIEWIKECRQMS